MTIVDDTLQLDGSESPPRRHRRLVVMAAVPLAAIVAFTAVAADRDDPAPVGHVTPQSSPPSRDEVVRDLVERGVVPAASLDDGTQVVGSRLLSLPPSRDEVVRDLVERGVVPAASLDDGTQVVSPGIGRDSASISRLISRRLRT